VLSSLCLQNDTLQCIRELLEAVSSKDPPFGMPSYPQSRAHYALDFMIKWDVNSNGKFLSTHFQVYIKIYGFCTSYPHVLQRLDVLIKVNVCNVNFSLIGRMCSVIKAHISLSHSR